MTLIKSLIATHSSEDYNITLYKHHLELFHKRRKGYNEDCSHSKKEAIMYGEKCIELGFFSREQLQLDFLPLVDLAWLMGKKGSIAGDGDE